MRGFRFACPAQYLAGPYEAIFLCFILVVHPNGIYDHPQIQLPHGLFHKIPGCLTIGASFERAYANWHGLNLLKSWGSLIVARAHGKEVGTDYGPRISASGAAFLPPGIALFQKKLPPERRLDPGAIKFRKAS